MSPTSPAKSIEYVVIGAGGHAVSVEDVMNSRGARVAAFVVGDHSTPERDLDARVLSEAQFAESRDLQGLPVVVAMGACDVRERVYRDVPRGVRAEAVVAASATVAGSATVGRGTVVHHHAHIGPGAAVGDNAIVNTSAVVEHGCVVGDHVHLAPASVLLGGARVGGGSFVGSGARILPGVSVGARATIGAGAVVTRDVADGETVVGVPARPLLEPNGDTI